MSPAGSIRTPSLRSSRRHWAAANGMLMTVFTSSSFTPGLAISWKWIGLNRSPMIRRPECGSKWCTSPWRPMIEFSTGIMPSSHAPDFTASNASSNTA